jgi:hypothetical protein
MTARAADHDTVARQRTSTIKIYTTEAYLGFGRIGGSARTGRGGVG